MSDFVPRPESKAPHDWQQTVEFTPRPYCATTNDLQVALKVLRSADWWLPDQDFTDVQKMAQMGHLLNCLNLCLVMLPQDDPQRVEVVFHTLLIATRWQQFFEQPMPTVIPECLKAADAAAMIESEFWLALTGWGKCPLLEIIRQEGPVPKGVQNLLSLLARVLNSYANREDFAGRLQQLAAVRKTYYALLPSYQIH